MLQKVGSANSIIQKEIYSEKVVEDIVNEVIQPLYNKSSLQKPL